VCLWLCQCSAYGFGQFPPHNLGNALMAIANGSRGNWRDANPTYVNPPPLANSRKQLVFQTFSHIQPTPRIDVT